MSFLDILILGIVVFYGFRGYQNGLVMTLAPLVIWFAAFFVAGNFMNPVGTWVTERLGLTAQFAPLIGFVTSFSITLGIGRALFNIVHQTLTKTILSPVNKLAGGGLGIVKGLLSLSIAFLVLSQFGTPSEENRNTSQLYTGVAEFVYVVWDYGTGLYPEAESLAEKFRDRLEQFESPVDPSLFPSP